MDLLVTALYSVLGWGLAPFSHVSRRYRLLLGCACWLAIAQLAWGVPGRISSYATAAATGNETQLVSVTMDDTRGTIPVAQLTGIDLVHLRMNANSTGSVTTVLRPNNATVVAANQRAQLLDADGVLNSGIINVPPGPGLAAGTTFTASSNGLAVNFLSPIVNGPGDDFVYFDFGSASGPTADSFVASAIVGGVSSGFATVSYYLPFQSVLATLTHSQANPISSLNDLETKALNAASSATTMDPRVFAGSFDFSDLGVPSLALVTGLFLTSATSNALFDPVFIAGLPSLLVPEPGAAFLACSASLWVLAARVRRHPTAAAPPRL